MRASDRLGRHGAVVVAATGYLQHVPAGMASSEVLWVRAEAYQASGDPERATDDHRELVERWPDTPHAGLAAEALAASVEAP